MNPPEDESKFALLHSASTPSQAKVFVALLEGAGIPAHVDGSMLADEFAISQRAMNQQGVKVRVPADRLAEAQQVIAGAEISDAELERQAMAAPRAESTRVVGTGSVGPRPATIGFALLAFVFMSLWLGASSDASPGHPLLVAKPGDSATKTVYYWRHTAETPASVHFDTDSNQIAEQVQFFNRSGKRTFTVADDNQDGLNEKTIEHRAQDNTVTWIDDDLDGIYDRCEVRAGSQLIQQLRFAPGRGYVPVER